MAKQSTKEHIVQTADQMFYEQGFEHTSFTQIAEAVGISRGNFYYHFKTKDDILCAVINLRMARTQTMLDEWQHEGHTPQERILCFVKILIRNQAKIKLYGCPVGTLSTELAKLNHPAEVQANQLFSLFNDWLKSQFIALGKQQEAESLAMHILAFSQGVATVAQAFKDEAFIHAEVDRFSDWLNSQIPST